VRRALGTLLWLGGYLACLATLLAGAVYFVGAVWWMHAPPGDVLTVAALPMALLLGAGWLCAMVGRRLRSAPSAPGFGALRTWLVAAVGMAVVVACAVLGHDAWQMVECGRNPPVQDGDGFRRVCNGDLNRFDISFTSIGRATRKLAFQPVDLARTPFAQLEPLGGQAEAVTGIRSRLYRGFRMPGGHTLTLSEHDMSADGVTTWRAPKDEPERINGLPARLTVLEDVSGTAVSHLSWVEGRRDYELWVDANIARVPLREQLFALAASLPRAVPACPGEKLRESIGVDENGFPIRPSLPHVLTVEEMDALGDRSKRPCK